jgi:hypothetical protein
LKHDVERAIASVIEAECPSCKVELGVHDGLACSPFCGDSYTAAPDRLEIRAVSRDSRRCKHWEAVWIAMPGDW